MSDNMPERSFTHTRVLLIAAIALVASLLVVLVALFVHLATPLGASVVADKPSAGLTWVRSMYGYGPSAQRQLLAPSSVAIGPDGSVYATDPVRGRILVFAPDGTFRRIVATAQGGGTGRMMRPESVSVDSLNNLYVADSWAGKVIVFDSRGRFLREWQVEHQARGIFVDANRVYVLDVGKVIVFDKQGRRLFSFGTRGRKPGQIDAYQGIVADMGRIFVADSYNQRVEAFDASGTLLWSAPAGAVGRRSGLSPTSTVASAATSTTPAGFAFDLPQDLTIDGKGRVVVVDAFRFDITTLDSATGKIIGSLGEFGPQEGQFYYPTSIAYDARRDWFAVADTSNNRVQIVRIAGSGAPAVAVAWRATSSPYRYLIVPGLVLLGAILLAIVLARRMFALSDAATSADERVSGGVGQ